MHYLLCTQMKLLSNTSESVFTINLMEFIKATKSWDYITPNPCLRYQDRWSECASWRQFKLIVLSPQVQYPCKYSRFGALKLDMPDSMIFQAFRLRWGWISLLNTLFHNTPHWTSGWNLDEALLQWHNQYVPISTAVSQNLDKILGPGTDLLSLVSQSELCYSCSSP